MKTLDPSKCSVLESSNVLFVDCDDTLIMWDVTKYPNRKTIKIKDPHLDSLDLIELVPHITHINIVKRNYHQGRTVIVWSAAGYEWAKTVVEALGLTKYVSLVMGKPVLYLDDRDMADWGGMRTYLSRDIEGDKQDAKE